MRLEYQNAEASQYASTIALQENEPMVAAARMAHWDNDSVSIREKIQARQQSVSQKETGDLHQWRQNAIQRACGSASGPDDKILCDICQVLMYTLR